MGDNSGSWNTGFSERVFLFLDSPTGDVLDTDCLDFFLLCAFFRHASLFLASGLVLASLKPCLVVRIRLEIRKGIINYSPNDPNDLTNSLLAKKLKA